MNGIACIDLSPAERWHRGGASAGVARGAAPPAPRPQAAPLGLSIAHISPGERTGSREHARRCERLAKGRAALAMADKARRRKQLDLAYITYSEGGELIKFRRPGEAPPGGGVRGKVEGFSYASRRRMIDMLNSLNREQSGLPIFLTLTYPNDWPGSPREWKKHLDTWLKRLRRTHPSVWGLWKLEPQRRGAPHYHLLLWGVEHVSKEWLSLSWYEVVGSGDLKHLLAGTRVESVRMWNGVKRYASKYLAKRLEDLPEQWREGVGRWWGVVNRNGMNEHRQRHTVRVVIKTWYRIRRILAKQVQRSGYPLELHRDRGCTVYKPAEWLPRLLGVVGRTKPLTGTVLPVRLM